MEHRLCAGPVAGASEDQTLVVQHGRLPRGQPEPGSGLLACKLGASTAAVVLAGAGCRQPGSPGASVLGAWVAAFPPGASLCTNFPFDKDTSGSGPTLVTSF